MEIGNCWADAFTNEQIYRCAAGVTMPPLDSLANLAEGAANVILMPLEEYHKEDELRPHNKSGERRRRKNLRKSYSKNKRMTQGRRSERNRRVIRKMRVGMSSFMRAIAMKLLLT